MVARIHPNVIPSLEELAAMGSEAQEAVYQAGNKYATLGYVDGSGCWTIDDDTAKYIPAQLDSGTPIRVDVSRIVPVAGSRVRIRKEEGVYVVKGDDNRGATTGDTYVTTTSVAVNPANNAVGFKYSGAKVYLSSSQSVSAGNKDAMSWDAAEDDNGSYWDSGSPTIISISTYGKYRVYVNGYGALDPSHTSNSLWLMKNGTIVTGDTLNSFYIMTLDASWNYTYPFQWEGVLEAGDVLALYLDAVSTQVMVGHASNQNRTWMSIQRLY